MKITVKKSGLPEKMTGAIFNLFNIITVAALPLLMLPVSCGNGKPDISKIHVNICIDRLDREIFEDGVSSLTRKYGNFMEYYTGDILGIGRCCDSSFNSGLERFRNDETVRLARSETEREYPDLDELTQRLDMAFRHYRYYFPDRRIPRIAAYISGFNHSLIMTDSILAVGLDKYLGAGCRLYSELGFPKYMSRNMNREKIPSDCISAWTGGEWTFEETGSDLLSRIIYEGKILYATKMMLPDEADTLIFGFTADQLKWCAGNEANMWTYIVENRLLFSTDRFTIRKLTEPAPFTSVFTPESPGKACNWIGYRIISKYMKENPGTTLRNLMDSSSHADIYRRSKYKP